MSVNQNSMEQLERDIAAEPVDSGQIEPKAIKKRPKVPNGHWKIEGNVRREASKYKTKSEFKRRKSSAYKSMVSMGLSDELFPLGKKGNGYWTKERLIRECKKYKTISEFTKKSPTAYSQSTKIPECVEIMDRMGRQKFRCGYWTLDRLKTESENHETINSFRVNAPGAYHAARDMGVIDIITSHMVSGYKKTNCTYIWKVSGYSNLYKIGVSNTSFINSRIQAVSRAHKFDVDWVIELKNDNPTNLEKRLLKFGKRPNINKADGYTEFRVISESELQKIMEIMRNDYEPRKL